MEDWLRRVVSDPAADYAADVRDEIGRRLTDAVLSIDMLFGAVLGAEAAGVPVAMLSPHVSIRPLAGVPPASAAWRHRRRRRTGRSRGRHHQLSEFMNGFLPALNRACAQLGVPALSHAMDLFDRPARVLLAMSQAFDFQADWLPTNFRYVGPLLDQPSWSEPWRAPGHATGRACWLPAAPARKARASWFSGSSARWASSRSKPWRPPARTSTSTPSRPQDNVHLLRSAPHDTVMQEVSLVISQGGHGTVNRALINGVPLLILPMGRDQGDNAARVEAKGAGLRLPPTASETEIASAAARLIFEPHFRLAARPARRGDQGRHRRCRAGPGDGGDRRGASARSRTAEPALQRIGPPRHQAQVAVRRSRAADPAAAPVPRASATACQRRLPNATR